MLRSILWLIATLLVAVVLSLQIPFELRPEQLDAFWAVTPWYVGFTLACFVLGEWTGNTSQVDKLWSIVPAIYAWLFAAESGWDGRVTLMAGVITVWAVRLTYNFGRRGGYTWPPWGGEEDYRWEVLRQNPLFKDKPLRYSVFNFAFICGYQMSLIYLFTLPVLVAWSGTPLGVADWLLAALGVGIVAVEYIADQQQYDFQTEKYRQINSQGEAIFPHSLGFAHTGLWAYSRHPNYMAEQAFWGVIFVFSLVATGMWFNPTGIGFVLLLLLFLSSSDFSEGLTLQKYPHYRAYVDSLPRFWIMPWTKPFDALKLPEPSQATEATAEQAAK